MIRSSEPQWDEMAHAAGERNLAWNEKVWTLLVADALDRAQDTAALLAGICGETVPVPQPFQVWFESQPPSPRPGRGQSAEGNTHLDLALGAIRERPATEGGIEYDPQASCAWVCFVEAKCLSDCSHGVKYDPLRNQVARVIENLLCFRRANEFPERLFFTLLTPRVFRDDPVGLRSRLYGYKFREYKEHPTLLLDEFRATDKRIPPRASPGISIPAVEERLAALRMNWVTIEDILEPDWGCSLDVVEVATNRQSLPDLSERLRQAVARIRQA